MATSILTVFFVFSGCKKYEESRPLCWDGKSINEFRDKTLTAMLWLRPSMNQQKFPANQQIYKQFDSNDYKLLLQCIEKPEHPSSRIKSPAGFNEILYLSFLDGTRYIIFFDIEKDVVSLQNGYSNKLYSLLSEKEISPEYRNKPAEDFSTDPNYFP